MLRTKFLVLAALLPISPLVHGQAGVQRNGFSQPSKQKTIPERLADHLKKHGHPVEQIKHKDGAITLTTNCQKGGRKWPVEIRCPAEGKKCKLICPLCNPTRFSSAKLLKLLSHKCRRGHFIFRESDNMLCFEDAECSTAGSDDDFQQSLDDFLNAVNETLPLWCDDAQPPAAIAPMPNLAKTSMSGKEDLGGYGKLAFNFESDRDVIMIDVDGETAGTYSIEKDRITLSFRNNTIIYTGTLGAQGITGTATNGRAHWNFSVAR